ncbi:MAG: sialate O-acetylesterase [Nitrospirae bacterium]|nr:sialate O-acetylesterase [Nitrospirota bacterium]
MFKPSMVTVILIVLISVNAAAKSTDDNKIVFLGDSLMSHADWAELFSNGNIKNRGIGGSTAQDIYNRLGDVINDAPKKVFIMAGTNDILRGKSLEQFILTYNKILKILIKKLPKAEIYVMSILPLNFEGDKPYNNIVILANVKIKQAVDTYNKQDKIKFLDIHESFTGPGTMKLNPLYTYDGIHLTPQGYLNWKQQIMPYVY